MDKNEAGKRNWEDFSLDLIEKLKERRCIELATLHQLHDECFLARGSNHATKLMLRVSLEDCLEDVINTST